VVGISVGAMKEYLGPSQPPIQYIPAVVSPRMKRLGREADQSLPANAKVKNAWRFTSIHPNVFMAWCLIKPGLEPRSSHL